MPNGKVIKKKCDVIKGKKYFAFKDGLSPLNIIDNEKLQFHKSVRQDLELPKSKDLSDAKVHKKVVGKYPLLNMVSVVDNSPSLASKCAKKRTLDEVSASSVIKAPAKVHKVEAVIPTDLKEIIFCSPLEPLKCAGSHEEIHASPEL